MWFAASLLFKSTHVPTEAKPAIWEESIRLILAATEEEAYEKARRIGNAASHAYDVEGGTVTWHFQSVERVHHIEDDALRDGSELFSRFLKDSEVQSLGKPFDD